MELTDMETAKAIVAILTLFIGVPVVIATLMDKFTLRPGKPRRTNQELEQELLEPQWDVLSKRLGGPPSDALRALYENKSKLLRREFELPSIDPGETHYVAGFLPARLETLGDFNLSKGHFPFASDGCGNVYTVLWGTDNVYFWDHEGGEEQEVGQSLAEFFL
jgi:SMI1 / KNR4 family (SUKH-1)